MIKGPYRKIYLPVSRASEAVQNQADTILSELHHSIDRATAFRAKMKARAAEKEAEEDRRTWAAARDAARASEKKWRATNIAATFPRSLDVSAKTITITIPTGERLRPGPYRFDGLNMILDISRREWTV